MDVEESWRGQIVNHYGICMEGLRKATKILDRIIGAQTGLEPGTAHIHVRSIMAWVNALSSPLPPSPLPNKHTQAFELGSVSPDE